MIKRKLGLRLFKHKQTGIILRETYPSINNITNVFTLLDSHLNPITYTPPWNTKKQKHLVEAFNYSELEEVRNGR